MLENLNIQDIAKWFEKGCDTNEFGLINNNQNKNGDKGFYFLECSDICLLSKLPDVKNKTLLDRAHKRLKKIKDPFARKDFLLTIISEFLRDGRKVIALKLISNEIDNETEMYKLFKSDLLFYRALCYLKVDKPSEALFDLYSALEKTKMQNIDRIHLQILEEIQKQMKNNKLTEGHIVVKDSYQITFMEILKQFEVEVCRFYQQQEEEKKVREVANTDVVVDQQPILQLETTTTATTANENNSNNNSNNILAKQQQQHHHHHHNPVVGGGANNNAGDWIESESFNTAAYNNNNNNNNDGSNIMANQNNKDNSRNSNSYYINDGNLNDPIIINTRRANNYKSIQLKQKLSTNAYNNNGAGGVSYGQQQQQQHNKNRFTMDNNNSSSSSGQQRNNNNYYYYNNSYNIHHKKVYQGKLIKKRQPSSCSLRGSSQGPPFNNRSYDEEDYLLTENNGHGNNNVGSYGKYNNRINQYETHNNNNNNNGAGMIESGHPSSIEVNITYSVDDQKARINVKQIINEPIIDNIFNLKAILVDNLCENYQIDTIYEIFEKFGPIVNVKQKDGSNKLIIEYDNIESPRYCISYLSQVELPTVSQPYKYLEFRFYKSENQRNFRICKQNQIKTSKECYFWRTTGCQNCNCKFYHNRLAKGVDYQEWMRIEAQTNAAQTIPPPSVSLVPSSITATVNNGGNGGNVSNHQTYGTTRIITNKSVKHNSSSSSNQSNNNGGGGGGGIDSTDLNNKAAVIPAQAPLFT